MKISEENDDSHDSGLFMNVKYNNSSAIKKMQLCGRSRVNYADYDAAEYPLLFFWSTKWN